MTKQEETLQKLSEKIFEPILIIDEDGHEWDAEAWLSFAKSQRIEIVSSKYVSFDELKKEYESEIQETRSGGCNPDEGSSD
jgi:hypothetical protein